MNLPKKPSQISWPSPPSRSFTAINFLLDPAVPQILSVRPPSTLSVASSSSLPQLFQLFSSVLNTARDWLHVVCGEFYVILLEISCFLIQFFEISPPLLHILDFLFILDFYLPYSTFFVQLPILFFIDYWNILLTLFHLFFPIFPIFIAFFT